MQSDHHEVMIRAGNIRENQVKALLANSKVLDQTRIFYLAICESNPREEEWERMTKYKTFQGEKRGKVPAFPFFLPCRIFRRSGHEKEEPSRILGSHMM